MSRQLKEVPARSYISTAAFNLNFFTYTTSMSPSTFKKSGDLSAVSGATSSNCPAGRVLRENGRKLYPGAHDISTVNGVATTFPSGTVMVGVFDNQSGLNGFIDPNAPMFAVYNGDRAGYLKDAVDPVGGQTDQGSPVLTNGALVADGQVRSSTITELVTVDGTPNTAALDASLGQVFTLTTTKAVTITLSNPSPGAQVFLIVTGDGSVVTFGTEIKGMGPLTATNGKIFTIHYICNGTSLLEVSRTLAFTDTT